MLKDYKGLLTERILVWLSALYGISANANLKSASLYPRGFCFGTSDGVTRALFEKGHVFVLSPDKIPFWNVRVVNYLVSLSRLNKGKCTHIYLRANNTSRSRWIHLSLVVSRRFCLKNHKYLVRSFSERTERWQWLDRRSTATVVKMAILSIWPH